MSIYTREQYLAESFEKGEAAHRRYYSQFVGPATVAAVARQIGREALLASMDPHLNDIPLHKWDLTTFTLAMPMKAAGDYLTKSGHVCIAKEAARQFIEANART